MRIRERALKVGMALAAVLLLGMMAGCAQFRAATRPLSMSIAVTYTDAGSDVTVRYSVPPPPPGRVYILWAYSRGQAQIAKLGVIQPGVERLVKGSVAFPIQGVNITLEASPDETKMGVNGVIGQTIDDPNFGPSAGAGGGGSGTSGNGGGGTGAQQSQNP